MRAFLGVAPLITPVTADPGARSKAGFIAPITQVSLFRRVRKLENSPAKRPQPQIAGETSVP